MNLINPYILGNSGGNAGPNFYVASTGNDTNPYGGTMAHPFLTVGAALAYIQPLIAGMGQDFTLHVVDELADVASYALAPLSGQNGFQFKISGGAEGLDAPVGILSAAMPVDGFTLFDAPTNQYVATYNGPNPSRIFINGEAYYPAFRGSGLGGTVTLNSTGYTSSSDPIFTSANPQNVLMVFQSTYNQPWNRVLNVNSGTHQINMLGGSGNGAHKYITSDPGFLYDQSGGGFPGNLLPSDVVNCQDDFLSQAKPGTFYYDPSNSVIYVIPRYLVDMTTATAMVPNGVETILDLTNAPNVAISGLGIQYAEWGLSQGFADRYSGFHYDDVNVPDYTNNSGETNMLLPPAAVLIDGTTDNIQINRECRILHCGGMGLHITGTATNITVDKILIDDIAGNGIVEGDSTQFLGSVCPDTVVVTNCVIQHVGRLYASSQGFQPIFWVNGVFQNNTVYDAPYNGMESGLGGGVNAAAMDKCGNNLVDKNHFINVMNGGTAIGGTMDGGAIGTNNNQNGTGTGKLIITGNYVQYAAPAQTGVLVEPAIYLDAESNGVTVGGAGSARNVTQYIRTFALYHELPIGNTVVIGANLSDEGTATVLGGAAPATNTAPTVSADPTIAGSAIITASGCQEPTLSLLLPVGIWDTLATAVDPVIWYRNDETSGTTVTNHGSAVSGNGTVAGGFTLNTQAIFTGISRPVTTFDGSTGKITSSVVSPVNFGKNTPFTVLAVIMPNVPRVVLNGRNLLQNTANDSAATGWQLRVDYTATSVDPNNRTVLIGSVTSDDGAGDEMLTVACADLSNDVAHVVGMTVDGSGKLSGLTLWVDGVAQPKFGPIDALTGAVSSSHALDVASNAGANSFWEGAIGDAIVIPGDIGQTAIENLTRAAGASIPPVPPGVDNLLLETGDNLLLETGDLLLLE